MKLEPRHWLWITAAVIAAMVFAIMVSLDLGGVFSMPGLMQE